MNDEAIPTSKINEEQEIKTVGTMNLSYNWISHSIWLISMKSIAERDWFTLYRCVDKSVGIKKFTGAKMKNTQARSYVRGFCGRLKMTTRERSKTFAMVFITRWIFFFFFNFQGFQGQAV